MIKLPPMMFKPGYSELVEKQLIEFMRNLFFKPIHDILASYGQEIKNTAASALIEAILLGRVQYVNGQFSGTYNARITKALMSINARYNKRIGAWTAPMDDLPVDIRSAVAIASTRFRTMHNDVMGYLDAIDADTAASQLELEGIYTNVIVDMESSFKQTVKQIGVVPEVTTGTVKVIAKDYSDNMRLYIKSWTADNIKDLRQTVLQNTFNGYRAETLVKGLQRNYAVSLNKAKFLARQETSLLMSKYREKRYKDSGVARYQWSSAGDARVRDRHAELDGKVFTWDNPPIIDQATGRRGHPGEDFGCRCVAVPVVDYAELAGVR